MLSKKRNGWLWVVMLFAVCAVVYGMLSSYPRELAVYSDELRYLDVARSLLQGRGLRVRNMPSDYQKILYPLCILPALLLKTTAAQITAIGWLNAVYMASAVFPAYALARAMGMNRRRTAFLVGVTAVLPTMSAASTFMSETVFLPLSLWQVYFFLRAMLAEPKARVGWCAAAGAFCYLLYLNKEVALYYLIAWVLVRAWVWWHDKASWRAELACNAALLGSFLVCFLLAKATLFRGLGNSYNQTGWLTAEQWRFLPFALVCDALFAVLAFWVFPVLLPLCGLHRPRRGSVAGGTLLPLFLLLSLLGNFGTNSFFQNIFGSALVAGLSVWTTAMGWTVNYDKMIIGTLMNLVPGIAITNVMRDILGGDLIAGIIKLVESLMVAVGIALGAGLAISTLRYFFPGI